MCKKWNEIQADVSINLVGKGSASFIWNINPFITAAGGFCYFILYIEPPCLCSCDPDPS